LQFNPYVICVKHGSKGTGVAVIDREEFLTYSKERRRREFCFISWITCQADEKVLMRLYPKFAWAIKWAHGFGLGPGYKATV
jgi:hypothetical protein